ncbi:MAG: hypothetical protein WCW44_06015 [archaeon]
MAAHKFLDIFSTVKEAIFLLIKHPVLFLPKLLIAIIYGISTLISISLVQQMVIIYTTATGQVDFSILQDFFLSAIFLLILTIVSFFVDLLFSGFYPILVNHALKGRISFSKSFAEFKPRIIPLLLSGIVLWLLITIVSVIEAIILLNFNFSELSLAISFIVTFLFIFLFYFLYPIIVFKQKGILANFLDNFQASLSNKKTVFVYSLIPFSVSIIKFAIAFFTSDSAVLIIFWILVVLTAIVYTVHVVVNQLLFIKTQKKK